MSAVEEHEGLIVTVYAAHFSSYTGIREDLLQEGRMAVWKALQTYDSTKSKFSGYAYMLVKRAMLDYVTKECRNAIVSDIEVFDAVLSIEDIVIKDLELQEIMEFAEKEGFKEPLELMLKGASQVQIAHELCISASLLTQKKQEFIRKWRENQEKHRKV